MGLCSQGVICCSDKEPVKKSKENKVSRHLVCSLFCGGRVPLFLDERPRKTATTQLSKSTTRVLDKTRTLNNIDVTTAMIPDFLAQTIELFYELDMNYLFVEFYLKFQAFSQAETDRFLSHMNEDGMLGTLGGNLSRDEKIQLCLDHSCYCYKEKAVTALVETIFTRFHRMCKALASTFVRKAHHLDGVHACYRNNNSEKCANDERACYELISKTGFPLVLHSFLPSLVVRPSLAVHPSFLPQHF